MIERIEVPGGWWEIKTRPTWGTVRIIQDIIARSAEDGTSAGDLFDHILVIVTKAWSFPEPVSYESLQERDLFDVLPVAKEVRDKIVPLYAALNAAS